jgi:hypothetical protein
MNKDYHYYRIAQPPHPDDCELNAGNYTKAFFRIYHNGFEVPYSCFNMERIGILDNLVYSIRGLTSTKTDYGLCYFDVCNVTATIMNIDKVFIRRFGDPNKRIHLRVKGNTNIQISFILY